MALVLAAFGATADAAELTLASTTSTENSGLLRFLLPKFRERTGITVRVVAVGTGAALRLGARGDADVVLVHAPAAERKFVAAGHGTHRYPVMYNDFILAGPKSDPARVRAWKDVGQALRAIAARRALFASRGDDSGTHKAERRFWKLTGTVPDSRTAPWYLETGAGMGATLNLAAGRGAYVLSDRATWLSFRNKRDLAIMFEGDPQMRNPYGIIPVNPKRHSHVRYAGAMQLVRWLTSGEGRQAIVAFRVTGRQVFFPERGVPAP